MVLINIPERKKKQNYTNIVDSTNEFGHSLFYKKL